VGEGEWSRATEEHRDSQHRASAQTERLFLVSRDRAAKDKYCACHLNHLVKLRVRVSMDEWTDVIC
jgi:hypothetical protein